MTESLRQPVTVGSSPMPAAEDPLALSLNENPFPPLPSVRTVAANAMVSANRYPEFVPNRLRRLIADHVGVAEDQVIVGSGATGVVMQILHALTTHGDRMVIATPTFDGYPILARMARLVPVTLPLDADGMHDLDLMAEACADARVVVLCRPHNPSGTIESRGDVERFLTAVPRDTVVLLDEAYVEFLPSRFHLDGPELVRRFPNVVVIRTFSKAYGLAGLRIGYAFGAVELTRQLWTMQLPFGMPVSSLAAVSASYAAESQLRQRIQVIAAEREHLRSRLAALGIRSTKSHANFLYLPAADLGWQQVFDSSAVRVRCYRSGEARITIGDRQSSDAVVAVVAMSRPDKRRLGG